MNRLAWAFAFVSASMACRPDAPSARPLTDPDVSVILPSPTPPPPPSSTSAPIVEGPPTMSKACASSAECETTFVGEDCCSHCGQVVANKASIAARERWCTKHLPASCPVIDCPVQMLVGVCVGGECVGAAK